VKPEYLKIYSEIQNSPVYDVAIKTPLGDMPLLSERIGHHILLKREDLQPVFSFKIRGAYHKIAQLSDAQKNQGIIAASAGNHAQGVALAAKKLNIQASIVMPVTTPAIKVNAVKRRGGNVILFGDTYDDAYHHAMELSKKNGFIFIHPFDDLQTLAGQGTVGLEILEQSTPLPDIIFVPVGGGGLLAGILIAIKKTHPQIKVIGVEPEDAACLDAALKANQRVILKEVGIFADGVAVKQIGEHTFGIAKDLIDGCITVTTDEICAAIKDIFEETRIIAEPAGALSLAGLKRYIDTHTTEKAKTLVAINSGANVNFDRLRHIAERAEIGEEKEGILGVTIPEKPGSFKHFCETIGKRGITEFNYRYSDSSNAQVFVGLQLKKGRPELETVIQKLEDAHYPVTNLTDNEMAKLHIRHMVGGHATQLTNERLYRFIFPERPGALLEFLKQIGTQWNISLFHYRNHGADFGRVLVGIQVDTSDLPNFEKFIQTIGYSCENESDNPAYNLFL
jgi:threonine dehydratase